MIVDVALPLPVDRTYSYRVPTSLAESVQPGSRVLVPLASRFVTGVVTGSPPNPPEQTTLRDVEDVLDDEPALTDELLRLTRWMADYYVCAWGEAIRAALPPGIDVESRLVVTRADAPILEDLADAEAAFIADLESNGPITLRSLERPEVGLSRARLQRLARQGLIAIELAMRDQRVRKRTVLHVRLNPDVISEGGKSIGERQQAILAVLRSAAREGKDWMPQSLLLEVAQASASSIAGLVERGMVHREHREVIRGDASDDASTPGTAHMLHPAQKRALDAIQYAVEAGTYAAYLLHGVTGSGKTEVYIAALKAALAAGRTGIVLVPEIALTPQTVGRFRAHFGDDVAVLHSRMSAGERYDAWRQLRDGSLRIAIGPRSAILAPLQDLGIIIVDEEHESSYKQSDPAPRYHARDVAVMRAHLSGAVCVLGSATPSLESWVNAVDLEKYTLLDMPDRVPVAGHAAAPLPPVRVVDLVKASKRHRMEGAFSLELLDAIRERLDRQEQVILLQNRRGFAAIVTCFQCGWVPECPDCSVTFTYHKASHQLKCHYCGRSRRMPGACPDCGSGDLSRLGTGTQRVEEELADQLPEARVIRMDLDTTTRKRAHHKLLAQFRRGEADILLGTQMVAKGLDFPRVTLVGVINADTGLLLPDFRAEEHAFQLLTQVAGRAGRADLRGEVILQTRRPDNPALVFAAGHDYQRFVDVMLSERKELRYPPFARLVVLSVSGPTERRVRELAVDCTNAVRALASDLIVLDAVPALIGRVKRRHRYRTMIRAPRGRVPDVQHTLRAALAQVGKPPRGYRIAVDVDAVDVV